MTNQTQTTLQLILKKLDKILKLLTLGRRSVDRGEKEKILNENDIFSRPDNPEHEFMRKESGLHFNRTPKEPEKPEEKTISQDKFNTAMHNVMNWVNKKKE